MAAGRTGMDFSFWVRSVSGSGVWRLIERVKLPWVRVRGDDDWLVGSAAGMVREEDEADGWGDEGGVEDEEEDVAVVEGLLWPPTTGTVRVSGAEMLAAMAGPAVVDRWETRRWLSLTSTPGVDRRKEAASLAQAE